MLYGEGVRKQVQSESAKQLSMELMQPARCYGFTSKVSCWLLGGDCC
jgi:hypothetical protein